MKLMTKEIAKCLPALYTTDGNSDKVFQTKFFDPCGRGTWYVVEGNPSVDDWLFYGYIQSPLGPDCDAWGYFSLSELKSIANTYGLGIERDMYFTPTPVKVILG